MTACPNPTKSRYATRAAAENAAVRATVRIAAPLRPYECVCTWYHLTSKPGEELPRAADADQLAIERLASIPDIDFREIVAADARGEGDRDERAALRHRRNLKRWQKQLGQFIFDAEQQLRDRRGDKSLEAHDWRKRATGHRDSLILRITECRRLRAEVHVELMKRGESRRRDAETAAALGATPKELRAHAGELAIERLIKEHRGEFERYLLEEYRAFGLEIPERFTKWTRQQQEGTAA
ncbi:hypothetical protein ACWEP4_40480 [Streptomyces sp. NPDC004227]